MNIVLALVLLVYLLHCSGKRKVARPAEAAGGERTGRTAEKAGRPDRGLGKEREK